MIPQKLHSCNFRKNAGVILMHKKLPKQAINETCCASLTLSAFSLDIGLVERVATIWSIMPKCSFIRRGENRVARRTRTMKLGRKNVISLKKCVHHCTPYYRRQRAYRPGVYSGNAKTVFNTSRSKTCWRSVRNGVILNRNGRCMWTCVPGKYLATV